MIWIVPLIEIENAASVLMWIGIVGWCLPAMWRVIQGRPQSSDPMTVVFGGMSFNAFWFSLRPLVFGNHAAARTLLDLLWSAAAYAFTFLCGFAIVRVIRFYRDRP